MSSEGIKLKQRQDASNQALDLKTFQTEQKSANEEETKSTEFNKNITGFKAISLSANLEINKTNPAKAEVEKGFTQRITKDYYLEEAVLIMGEM